MKTPSDIFLENLAECGSVTESAKAAGMDIFELFEQIETDQAFKQRYDLARLVFKENCQIKLLRRAVDGYEQDVWFQGEIVGTKLVYSDTLAKTFLDRFIGLPLLNDPPAAATSQERQALEIAIDGLLYAAEQKDRS